MRRAPDADDPATEIVAGCWDRLQRGEAVDEDAVVRAHPELADELRRRFDALRRVELAYGGDDAPHSAAVTATAPSLAGKALGAYRLESALGTGGMGTVYLASVAGRVPGLAQGERVALKVVHPHLLARDGFFRRFLREAEIGRRVRHENVVRTFDADAVVGESGHHHFLVMEYVEGQTLRALLAELERVPEELCRHVGREVAKALAAIHGAGAVHRDLKPDNVLITNDHVVKVMDLGVARMDDDALRLSQTGAFVGSVRYAAPEQFRGRDAVVDGRADLYALGLVLYELATGKHPFDGDDFHAVLRRQMTEVPRPAGEVNPQLSAFFEEVLRTLLAKDPDGRFASAAEVAQILADGEKGEWWHTRAKALRIESKRPLRRIRVPRETAVYGRDAEIARLRELFDAAKAGDGRIVLVEGEAGIGKSRLVDEFVGRLRAAGEDVNFLFGSYPPGGAATSSGAFSTAFREHFGEESLEDALREALPQTPILVPAFAALLRGDAAPSGAEQLTKDSLQTVFVHATRSLAAGRPTVVLIDDLHFAPEEGRALFAALALAVPGHRVLLVGTARPGLDETWLANLDRIGVSRMPLPRLGPREVGRLLVDAFRSERLADELGFRIVTKSDGNPFFVFEILRGLREGQFIKQQPDGTWVTTQIIRDIQIPSSVLDLVNARVADLAAEERNLLDVASCVGFEFDPSLVGAVLGMALIPALQAFARIEKKHRLVRSAARRYVFDHHQVQEALYGGLFEQLREQYHASIAAAIELQTGAAAMEPKDVDGAVCVDLAEHFLKGAQGPRALRYLDSALTHLEKGYLNDAAVRLSDRALEVPQLVVGTARVELLLRKSRRLDLLGRRDAQRDTLERARSIADEIGDTPLRNRTRRVLGGLFARIGEYEAAIACYRDARELTVLARQSLGPISGALGTVLYMIGHVDEAQRELDRSIALAADQGDKEAEARGHNNIAACLLSSGLPVEARNHAEQALALARTLSRREFEAAALSQLAGIHVHSGHYAAARGSCEDWLRLNRLIGDRPAEGHGMGNLGGMLLVLGRFDEARVCLEGALTLCREVSDPRHEQLALDLLAELAEQSQHVEVADSLRGDALGICRAIGHRVAEAQILLAQGASCVRRARDEEGRTALLEALSLATEIELPLVDVLARATLARLSGGSVAAASSAFESHERQLGAAGAMEARFTLWRATDGLQHLSGAKRLLDHLVAHAPPDCRESMLTNVRLHREIVAAAAQHGL